MSKVIQNIRKAKAYQDLASCVCAACGKSKKRKQSFCYVCYAKLTDELKTSLWSRNNYEDNYLAALDFLDDLDFAKDWHLH